MDGFVNFNLVKRRDKPKGHAGAESAAPLHSSPRPPRPENDTSQSIHIKPHHGKGTVRGLNNDFNDGKVTTQAAVLAKNSGVKKLRMLINIKLA